MQKGFNSDIFFQGESFHVQTEDWGESNPYFVSRVFQKGAVKKSIKVAHSSVLPNEFVKSEKAIRQALQIQHQKILDLLLSGQLL